MNLLNHICTLALSLALTQTIRAQTIDVQRYWKHINQAELRICDGENQLALAQFDSAFLNKTPTHARDLYNAALCAIEVGDFLKTRMFLENLVRLGCDHEFFIKKMSFIKFQDSDEWKTFVNNYQKNRSLYFEKTNFNLRNEVESIIFKDMEYRVKRERAAKGYTHRDLEKYDSLTSDMTLAFIAAKGYPSEEEIGVFIENDTSLVLHPSFSTVILHSYLQGRTEFTPILLNALYQGKIRPEQFWWWRSHELTNQKDKLFGPKNSFHIINKRVYEEKYNDQAVPQFNVMRTTILLPSIADSNKKIITFLFEPPKARPDFLLKQYLNLSILHNQSEDEVLLFERIFYATEYKYEK